jgi:hypothetical protein
MVVGLRSFSNRHQHALYFTSSIEHASGSVLSRLLSTTSLYPRRHLTLVKPTRGTFGRTTAREHLPEG